MRRIISERWKRVGVEGDTWLIRSATKIGIFLFIDPQQVKINFNNPSHHSPHFENVITSFGQSFPLRNSVDRFLSVGFFRRSRSQIHSTVSCTFVFLLCAVPPEILCRGFFFGFCFCLFEIVDLFLRMMKLFRHFLIQFDHY